MKEYVIPWVLLGELVFPDAGYGQQQVNILHKSNIEAVRRLDDIKQEEARFGKKIWERFWLCKDFDIDTSNPDLYVIKDNKCERITLYGRN